MNKPNILVIMPDTFVGRTAVDYLAGYGDDKPFAVFVGIGGPHDPWDPPQTWADRLSEIGVPAPLPPSPPSEWFSHGDCRPKPCSRRGCGDTDG